MKKLRIFCLIMMLVLMVTVLAGCNSNNENSDKTSLFGKYEVFTDADLELFQNAALKLSINGNTYTLGMTKDEIESILGETGQGYYHSSSSIDSTSSGNHIVEPGLYEYYTTVNNYYYYPKNKMAIIYRSVQDGKETNNPAVLISVNNSKLVDSEGFSPGIDLRQEIRHYLEGKYGEKLVDKSYGTVGIYYNETGVPIPVRDYITHSNSPGAWISYYANGEKAIDSITIGCRKSNSTDDKINGLWR